MDDYVRKLVAFAETVAQSQDGDVIAEIGEDFYNSLIAGRATLSNKMGMVSGGAPRTRSQGLKADETPRLPQRVVARRRPTEVAPAPTPAPASSADQVFIQAQLRKICEDGLLTYNDDAYKYAKLKVAEAGIYRECILAEIKKYEVHHKIRSPIRSRKVFYVLLAILFLQMLLTSPPNAPLSRNLKDFGVVGIFYTMTYIAVPDFIPIHPAESTKLLLTMATATFDFCVFQQLSSYIKNRSNMVFLPPPQVWRNEANNDTLILPSFRNMTIKKTEEVYRRYKNNPLGLRGLELQKSLVNFFVQSHDDICVTNPFIFENDRVNCGGSKCFSYLNNCIRDVNKRMTIVPVWYEYETSDDAYHASTILINHVRKEVELYDPNGLLSDVSQTYSALVSTVTKVALANNFIFIGQVSFGMQILDHLYDARFGGMCLIYANWFIDIRLLNPDKSPETIDALLLRFVDTHPFAIYGYLAERMDLHRVGSSFLDKKEYYPVVSNSEIKQQLENDLRRIYSEVQVRALKRMLKGNDNMLRRLAFSHLFVEEPIKMTFNLAYALLKAWTRYTIRRITG